VGSPSAGGFQSAVPGNTTAKVTWWPGANNGSPITGYTVTPYIGLVAQPAQNFPSTINSVTVTGLTNGTAYTFTISATNANGTGPATAPTAPVTPNPLPPSAPGNVTSRSGNGGATLTWKAPSSDGGSPITGYVVTPYLAGTAQAPVTFGSTATSQVVGGLANGGSYTFSVQAVNGTGTGPASPQSAALVVGTPGQPSFGTATAGVGQARITWWAPAGNGGPITGYTITPFVNGVAQTPVTITGNTQQATITGLTAGTAYTFAIVANNAYGPSVASNQTKPVTPT
jgi:titin